MNTDRLFLYPVALLHPVTTPDNLLGPGYRARADGLRPHLTGQPLAVANTSITGGTA